MSVTIISATKKRFLVFESLLVYLGKVGSDTWAKL